MPEAVSVALHATAAPLAHPHSYESPLERRARALLVRGGHRTRLQRSLSSLARLLGALDVDLLDVLGGLGEHDDAVAANVHEAAEHGQHFLAATLFHPELP